jgi:enoyl-CoA hydratase
MITLEKSEHIATVTLDVPTMAPAFFDTIGEHFRALAKDPEVRAIVLRSSTKAFSYGLDLMKTFQEKGQLFQGGGLAGPRTDFLAMVRDWQNSFNAVATAPVPVIAAVHGWCIGGGLDLISACDIVIASEDARFSLREAKLAIVADLGSLQRLPARIGIGHTRELAYTAGDITASRAAEIGLVNHLHPTREATHNAADTMAREIAANPPLTIRGIKDVLQHGEGKTVAEGLAYVATWNAAFLQSEDLAEAISAFMAKRSPAFKGR